MVVARAVVNGAVRVRKDIVLAEVVDFKLFDIISKNW
jgi:hypothetical protein